jgi:SAM-dependent methyltransferase
MNSHNRERAEHFSRGAKGYDRVTPRPFAVYGQQLVDRAARSPGSRVLDVATGRGAVLLPAARQVGRPGLAVGVDLSWGMLCETAVDVRGADLDQAVLCRSDAHALPFAEGTFDALFCGHAIWAFPQAIHEFHRVLAPGGMLALTIVAEGCFDWVLDALLPYERAEDPEPEERRPVPPITTPEGLRALIEDTGFARIEVTDEETPFRYTHKDEWWDTLWAMGTGGTMERMSPTELADFRRAIYDALERFQRVDGVYIPWRVLTCLACKA